MWLRTGLLLTYPSVWRPLNLPVQDCPLAVCDPRTVDTRDLLAADRVTPAFAVEVYYLKHNPAQEWYWLRQQTPGELMVFVNYDSACNTDKSPWMSKYTKCPERIPEKLDGNH